MENNKYKRQGLGDLQDQKWMNMGAEEGHGEEHLFQYPGLPGGMQGAGGGCGGYCALGAGAQGSRDRTTGSPHPLLLLLLAPGNVNGQFSQS